MLLLLLVACSYSFARQGCYTGGTQASDGGRKVSPELQEKALSLGFRVDYTADKGRVCVAGRPFEPGQVGGED